MAKKTVAFRKVKKKGRFGIVAILITLAVFISMFAYNGRELRKQKQQLEADTAVMEQQLAGEQERAEELKQFETYTHTKKYAEEVAKEKLGYVYEGEIIFQKDQ